MHRELTAEFRSLHPLADAPGGTWRPDRPAPAAEVDNGLGGGLHPACRSAADASGGTSPDCVADADKRLQPLDQASEATTSASRSGIDRHGACVDSNVTTLVVW
ncbi:hypothetical protein [Streptomyces sp. NPDC002463]|uniref:hypothetical protein n=1 Tax=Streptomyces sp. NPDC002463 TaxID=3364645 RepID=UPI0036744FE7